MEAFLVLSASANAMRLKVNEEHFTDCFTLIIIIIWGWCNRPVVGSVLFLPKGRNEE
jgi:hypothetical protein